MAGNGNGEHRNGRTAAQVRSEIEKARSQIADSVEELRREVAQTTDWKTWVDEKPWTWVAGAFVVGFLLGNRR